MSEAYRVDVRSVDGGPTAVGSGGSVTVVIDRPTEAGGRGLGFNGGQLLNLGSPATSTPIEYEVDLSGDPSAEALGDLVAHVDRIAEIPSSIRRGTEVRLRSLRRDASWE